MPAESTILVLGVTDPHLEALVREGIGVFGAAAQFHTNGEDVEASAVVSFVGERAVEQIRAQRNSSPAALIAVTENPAFAHAQALLDAGADSVLLSSQLEQLPVSLAAAAKAARARAERDYNYALQKALNDHSPTEMFVKDTEGRYIYVNRTTAERYAELTVDIIGKRSGEIFEPADSAGIVEHDREVLETGQVATRTVTIFGRHLQVTKFPVYDHDSEVIGIGAIAVDVSEQQNALQALRTTESRVQDYAELAADIFYETGPDWLLTRCDGRFEEITGLNSQSVIGTERLPITRQDRQSNSQKWRDLNEKLKRHEAVTGFELNWTRSDGKQVTLLNNIKPMFDDSGEFAGYRGVAVDITALRDAQRALRKEEEHFRFVVENSSDFVTVLDSHGVIRYQSPSIVMETGYTSGERIGKSPLLYVHPDDRDYVSASLDGLAEEAGRVETLVYRFQSQSGDWRHIESRCRSVAGASGAREIVINSRDVSKRIAAQNALREAENALRASEERFRTLIENAGDVITVLDGNGLIRYQSPSITRALGYDTVEMLGDNPLDYIHPDDQQLALAAIQRILSQSGNEESAVFRLRHKEGEWRYFESHGRSALRNEAMELILNSRDVSDRIQVETTLRDSEELLRTMLDNSPVAMFIKDTEERFVYLNKISEEVLEVKANDVIGRTAMEVWPVTASLAAEQDRKVLESGSSLTREAIVRHSDGLRSMLMNKFPIYNAKGDMTGVAGVGIDITERVTAEQAQRDSEELLQGIMNHSPNEVFIKDLEKRYIYINKRCEELFGLTNEHARGKRAQNIFPLHTAQEQEKHDEQVIRTEQTVINQEEVPYVDGTHTVITAKFPIREATGRVVSIGAVATDITEGSAAARALRVSEEHFRNLVEGSLQGILIHNLNEVLFVNQAFLDIFGYASLDEIKTAYVERRVIAPRDSDRIRQYANSRLTGDEGPQRYEFDAIKADGSTMQTEASGRRINWQGKPALQTTVLDITERKQAERALQQELRRNQIVLESSQDGYFTCDMNGRLRDVNHAYERMLGYAPGEMVGMNLADVEEFEEPAGVKDRLARIANEGQDFFETRHRHKDGHTVDFEVAVTAATIDQDTFIFSFMRDVTDRNKALADLRESQARLQALTTLAPAGIFRTDTQGRTSYVNEHWTELTGILNPQPRGDDWLTYLHSDDHERILKHWSDRLANRTVFRDEYRYQRPQGSLVWVYCVANPQYDQRGEFIGYIGALTNITARKQAQSELERYRDHLEELVDARTAELRVAVREQESFSYSVSHDLRSPLRTIDGFSHMLLDEYNDVLDAEGRKCLTRVRAASQRMGHLIDALLNLSRMSRRKMRPETVNLSNIANDILRRLRNTDPGRDAQLLVAENLRANGDSALLRVVLENLLSNAWKYSNKQERTVIEVQRIDGQKSGFLVRDNGVGFDMRYVGKLFKPFQRLHTFEEFEGTGIGLATVVRIIERHGGRVWAESEEGKGATFYFTVL